MTFLKNLIPFVVFFSSTILLITSCGSDDDTNPSSDDPAFTMNIALGDFPADSIGGYNGSTFIADLDEPFVNEDGDQFPSQAIALVHDDTLQITAYDIRNGDTSAIEIITTLKPDRIGTYRLSAFSEDLLSTAIGGVFGAVLGEEPSSEPPVDTDIEAISFYISTQLPDEFLFAVIFGAFESSEGGVLNITEYDETNKTMSGNFSFDYKIKDENEIFLNFEDGKFNKLPIIFE